MSLLETLCTYDVVLSMPCQHLELMVLILHEQNEKAFNRV